MRTDLPPEAIHETANDNTEICRTHQLLGKWKDKATVWHHFTPSGMEAPEKQWQMLAKKWRNRSYQTLLRRALNCAVTWENSLTTLRG